MCLSASSSLACCVEPLISCFTSSKGSSCGKSLETGSSETLVAVNSLCLTSELNWSQGGNQGG